MATKFSLKGSNGRQLENVLDCESGHSQCTTSLLEGLCESNHPVFVSMMVVVEGGGFLRCNENWKEKERERMIMF